MANVYICGQSEFLAKPPDEYLYAEATNTVTVNKSGGQGITVVEIPDVPPGIYSVQVTLQFTLSGGTVNNGINTNASGEFGYMANGYAIYYSSNAGKLLEVGKSKPALLLKKGSVGFAAQTLETSTATVTATIKLFRTPLW
ncbi:MAG: hypothetical protein FWG88_04980 [Oscillospiraceae bacterium]|nr:hypothetical protein [Oscillospiraceae bacterium]